MLEQAALEKKQESVESRSITSGDSSVFKEAFDTPRVSTGAKPLTEQQINATHKDGSADTVLTGVIAQGFADTPKLYGKEAPLPTRISAPPMMEMVAPVVGKHDQAETKSAETPMAGMKPLVGSAELTEQKAPEIPMVTPVLSGKSETRDAAQRVGEAPKLEGSAEAEALRWDKWNKDTFKEFQLQVGHALDQKHPDLQVPREYQHLATDVPHLQAKYDVTVESDGSISKIERQKASGSAYLDNAVKRGIEHMGASGKLQFPEGSEMKQRVLHMNYGWNWKGDKGYPTGQVEYDGKLQQSH